MFRCREGLGTPAMKTPIETTVEQARIPSASFAVALGKAASLAQRGVLLPLPCGEVEMIGWCTRPAFAISIMCMLARDEPLGLLCQSRPGPACRTCLRDELHAFMWPRHFTLQTNHILSSRDLFLNAI